MSQTRIKPSPRTNTAFRILKRNSSFLLQELFHRAYADVEIPDDEELRSLATQLNERLHELPDSLGQRALAHKLLEFEDVLIRIRDLVLSSERTAIATSNDDEELARFSSKFTALKARVSVMVSAMIDVVIDVRERRFDDDNGRSSIESLPHLASEAIPEQQLGPFSYEFVGSRLSVAHVESRAKGNQAHVDAAQIHLIEQARKISELLSSNNSSPELKAVFLSLAEKLEDRSKILLLGLQVGTARAVFVGEEETLMDSLAAFLRDYLAGLGRYLDRFDDWREYVRESAGFDVSEEDEELLIQTTHTVARELDQIPIVDEEVIVSLDTAARWPILESAVRSEQILARTRTLGNILLAVYKRISKVIIDEAMKALGRVIVTYLGGIGLKIIFSKLVGFEWFSGLISGLKDLLNL